jgi:hypothetical protein
MVDGVAVFDTESVLAISPRYVERVELYTAPYVRGNITFGGIINLVTLEGNMGYMDLPASGLMVRYALLQRHPSGLVSPAPADPRMPDVRNTLYWDPMLTTIQKEDSGIRFPTPDAGGRYCVLIRGYNSSGSYIQRVIPLEVE